MRTSRKRRLEDRESYIRPRIITSEGKVRLPSRVQLDSGHLGFPRQRIAGKARRFMQEHGMPSGDNSDEEAINHVSRTITLLRGWNLRGGKRRREKEKGMHGKEK